MASLVELPLLLAILQANFRVALIRDNSSKFRNNGFDLEVPTAVSPRRVRALRAFVIFRAVSAGPWQGGTAAITFSSSGKKD